MGLGGSCSWRGNDPGRSGIKRKKLRKDKEREMRKVSMFISMSILLLGLIACTAAQPKGDQEAVLLMQPVIFGHGGVDPVPVQSGLTWCVYTTQVIYFPITPVQFKEPFDDLITDDNNPVDFDVYIELQIEKGKTPILYKEFGEEWYKNNVAPYARKLVRDRASQHKTFDLAGNREVLNDLESFIQTELTSFLVAKSMPVKVNRIVMGKVTPPQAVLEETMKTAAQQQAILTQRARAQAEQSRGEAEKQKAIADDMYKNTFGMSVPEYLQLRKLEIEKEKIELIRDKQNITVILSEGGGLPTTYPVK
jgi:regulator of protease activity HflC (stomatin/prohibitin superfamily)